MNSIVVYFFPFSSLKVTVWSPLAAPKEKEAPFFLLFRLHGDYKYYSSVLTVALIGRILAVTAGES